MYQRLSNENAELLIHCLLIEQETPDFEVKEEDLHLLGKIIKKRIDVLKLPIKFNNIALLSVTIFCAVPGHAVVLLIDCLNKYENETVTVGKLCELYPMGFYTDKEVQRYVEEEIKTKLKKFSYVY